MLVFRAGSPHPKAVPLSLVTRLEDDRREQHRNVERPPLVQYRGQLMPLVPVNAEVRIKASGNQPLLVFSDQNRSMASSSTRSSTSSRTGSSIELASDRPGLIGTAVIKGQATEIIDVAHYLPLAFEDWHGWKERQDGDRSRPAFC